MAMVQGGLNTSRQARAAPWVIMPRCGQCDGEQDVKIAMYRVRVRLQKRPVERAEEGNICRLWGNLVSGREENCTVEVPRELRRVRVTQAGKVVTDGSVLQSKEQRTVVLGGN